MAEINLLKYYNMTLAEIHKATADIDKSFKPVERTDRQMGWFGKFMLTFIIAMVCFLTVAVVFILTLNPFSGSIRPPVEYTQPEIPVEIPIVAIPEYVQIQVIEFDGPAEGEVSATGSYASSAVPETEILPSLAPRAEERPVAPSRPQVAPSPTPRPQEAVPRNPPAAVAPAPQPSARQAVPSGLYSINIAGITPAEYDILNNLTNIYSSRITIVNTDNIRKPQWVVYVPQAGTGIFVEDIEVTRLRPFDSRGEALLYAEQRSTNVIIRMEEMTDLRYDLKICCMELENARLFAQTSGIEDKLFQLRKE